MLSLRIAEIHVLVPVTDRDLCTKILLCDLVAGLIVNKHQIDVLEALCRLQEELR